MFSLSLIVLMSVSLSNFLPENGAANTIIMIEFFVHIYAMEFLQWSVCNCTYLSCSLYCIDSAMISVHALHVSICRISPLCL